ncbi:helix-turn-helix domain-containing protein [Glutamicibacter sp. NPDC087344]|uniref:helix-turn-helix domain-containing protein n=1 Tax=Glutamicibacter sp. NPDC087344 TaxID=3363994 RepID=UPI003823F8B0
MTQELDVDRTIRQRIRALRQSRGWSLESLASKADLSVSTLSRIETGSRRIALDQLIPLARALGTTLDELVATGDQDVVIRPEPVDFPGMTIWKLSNDDAVNGVTVSKIRYDSSTAPAPSEARIHPGKEWFTVLSGEMQLKLGDRTYHIMAGQAAQFDTLTPHVVWAVSGVAEVLSIMDHEGRRAHGDDRPS